MEAYSTSVAKSVNAQIEKTVRFVCFPNANNLFPYLNYHLAK